VPVDATAVAGAVDDERRPMSRIQASSVEISTTRIDGDSIERHRSNCPSDTRP